MLFFWFLSVTNCNEWNTLKKTLMLKLVRAKYMQNEDLKQILLDTGNRKIGETWRDSFFSIGLPLTHPDVLNCEKLKSNNQLRQILEIVIHYIRGI